MLDVILAPSIPYFTAISAEKKSGKCYHDVLFKSWLKLYMEIRENVSLSDLNTFGVDQSTRYFVSITQPEDLAELLKFKNETKLPVLILGGGSNLLFSQNFEGIVAHISLTGIDFIETDSEQNLMRVAAGERWDATVRKSIAFGWQGLENLAYIPGNTGAAPIQNIGAYGLELCERFDSLRAFDCATGEVKKFSKEACQFGYRDSFFKSSPFGQFIVTEVTLALPREADWRLDYAGIRERLGDTQPSSEVIADIITAIRKKKLPDPNIIGNAGSFFKNPVVKNKVLSRLQNQFPSIPIYPVDSDQSKLSAAWLIEQSGLKGYREGDAGVSEQHALVLVNHGKVTGAELLRLATHVQKSVGEKFDIQLEPEPTII